ncbi:SxtJ family membrane protein [Pelagibacteraceae bacterium]|nr:SxtJ family membrane protein [Pelagibacteraceae bacterium]
MKTNENNKSFGILFFVVFLLVGLWPLIKSNEPRIILLPIALMFLILGLTNSRILSPLNRSWVKLGELLGRIIAPIVMALVYFTVLTPISFLVKIMGKDLLKKKFSNIENTYWIKREKSIGSMDKQF